MPKSCCVYGCTNNIKSNPELAFYILPRKKDRRRKWLNAIGRAEVETEGNVLSSRTWSPKSLHVYVCSQHFITGMFYPYINILCLQKSGFYINHFVSQVKRKTVLITLTMYHHCFHLRIKSIQIQLRKNFQRRIKRFKGSTTGNKDYVHKPTP